jgi:hypothetical protein
VAGAPDQAQQKKRQDQRTASVERGLAMGSKEGKRIQWLTRYYYLPRHFIRSSATNRMLTQINARMVPTP